MDTDESTSHAANLRVRRRARATRVNPAMPDASPSFFLQKVTERTESSPDRTPSERPLPTALSTRFRLRLSTLTPQRSTPRSGPVVRSPVVRCHLVRARFTPRLFLTAKIGKTTMVGTLLRSVRSNRFTVPPVQRLTARLRRLRLLRVSAPLWFKTPPPALSSAPTGTEGNEANGDRMSRPPSDRPWTISHRR